MIRFSVFQFHLQLIKTTWQGKSSSAGCDVKARLRNRVFYTTVPLLTDFQRLLLLSARNAWGRQIRFMSLYFRVSKYNVVFNGSFTRPVPSHLNLLETKERFDTSKASNSKRISVHKNGHCYVIWKRIRLSDVKDFAMLLAQTFGGK